MAAKNLEFASGAYDFRNIDGAVSNDYDGFESGIRQHELTVQTGSQNDMESSENMESTSSTHVQKHSFKESLKSEKSKVAELIAQLPAAGSKQEVFARNLVSAHTGREKADFLGAPRLFDPDFKGPLDKRSCTDVPCLLIFFAFLGFWAYVAVFAFQYGVIERAMYPTDSRGQICGKDLAQGRPYLFYFDLTQCMSATVLVTGCLTETKCVESCPTSAFSWMELAASHSIDTSRLICSDDVNVSEIQNFRDLTSAISSQKCASYYFPSGSVGGRCLPGLGKLQNGSLFKAFENSEQVGSTSNAQNETVTHEQAINGSKWLATAAEAQLFLADSIGDLKNTWWFIIICYGVAGILSLVWIILMKWMASWLVWLAICGFLAMLSYFAYYCFHMAEALKSVSGTDGRLIFTLDLTTYATKQDFWLALGSIVSIILAVLVLIILHLRKRISIAISLLEEGSKAVSSVKSALLFPLIPFIMEAVTLAWGITVGLYLISSHVLEGRVVDSSEIETEGLRNNDTCDPNMFERTYPNTTARCRFSSYSPPGGLRAYEVCNVFAMLWTIFFIGAASDMILAGVFAIYYWTWDKSRLPKGMISTSLWRTCRFHLGSVAFGALLVTIIRMVRGLVNSLHKRMKAFSGNQTGFLLKCCSCCLWCLEKFLKFINRNAYILIAIYGNNFLTSAKAAYLLLLRNVLRFVALDSITAFILAIGKVVIAGLLGAASYYYVTQGLSVFGTELRPVHHVFIPVAAVVVGTYFIVAQFFQVYEMAVDTIFLCFLEDSEQNDGSPEKPYFMTRKLMMLLEKKRKEPLNDGGKDQHYSDLAKSPHKDLETLPS